VEEATIEPKRSKPFEVFEANVFRLIALTKAPPSNIPETVDRLRQQTETSTATVQKLGEVMRTPREGGYDSAAFQEHAAPLLAGLKEANQTITDLVSLIKTRQFLSTWMIVMLVTFAEAYFEDVLLVLIAGALQGSSLPPAIADDITKRWIRNLIRGGNPHTWIKQLETFGATGFDPGLAGKMQSIWDRRHKIAHTAEPEINQAASQELIAALLVVRDFAEATDAFVVASASKNVIAPTSP
jgi:hypothetical protein